MEKGRDLMINRNTFDSVTGRVYTRRIVIRDGVRKDKPFFVRLYNPSEMRDLLKKAGMNLVKIFGDWNSLPLTDQSSRMVLIARKE
jgi:hypothetical protein